jgi:hypothetical protein
MKALIFILVFFSVNLYAQDTIMLSKVVDKKTTIRIITKDTADVETEIREVLNYDKVIERIRRLGKDTVAMNEHLKKLDDVEIQLINERRKTLNQKKQSLSLIDRLKLLLPDLL